MRVHRIRELLLGKSEEEESDESIMQREGDVHKHCTCIRIPPYVFYNLYYQKVYLKNDLCDDIYAYVKDTGRSIRIQIRACTSETSDKSLISFNLLRAEIQNFEDFFRHRFGTLRLFEFFEDSPQRLNSSVQMFEDSRGQALRDFEDANVRLRNFEVQTQKSK
ncbi:unnamed protein product [Trichogramma brassicae]|uniref:Uncharacterized protein n=1 Tax=Trichogramma brassicae TaxID=86971 RepID=A0A6H5I5V2_9HYME|nr:unnamed protein product [Trichogramma brassicae]